MNGSELFLLQQMIVSLQTLDALSGAPVTALDRVNVALRHTGENEFRALAATGRFLPGGYVTFAGDPNRIFRSDIAPGTTIDIRIQVAAAGYTTLEETVTVSGTLAQLQEFDREIAGGSYRVRALTGPLLRHTLALQPTPVGLQGAVFADGDPQHPVAGVTLSVIVPAGGPSTASDTNGRYRFDVLPLASSITLRIAEATPQETEVQHLINYRQPLNTRNITLP